MISPTKMRWYAHRLRAMNAAELRQRLAERCRHLTQGRFLRKLGHSDWNPERRWAPALPDAAEAPAELRRQLTVDAARLGEGEWQMFGWRDTQPVRFDLEGKTTWLWHRDPTGLGCGWLREPWKIPAHRLDHRHLGGDDVRCVWEINRWAEMTRLAMHGWLNDDHAALKKCHWLLANWCADNPTGYGLNWTSPLEAALRLINFTWIDTLVCAAAARGEPDAAGLCEEQERLARAVVPSHAAWIWRHLSFGSSANNHLLGELAALVLAASRWPATEQITGTAAAVWTKLGEEILRQFAEDGGNGEQALHYHFFAWELCRQAAAAAGCDSGPVHDRLTQAAHFFADMTAKGEPWDFGDSDDAQVVPLTLNRAHAAAEWQQWQLGQPGALRFWLGPPSAAGVQPSPGPWRSYPKSGMAVCRSGSWQVRLDGSPLGFGPLAAHGHCDAMHVSIWDDGHALLIDPGTGRYFADTALRRRLAAWDAHNGPQPLGGYRTPVRVGTFLQVRHHDAPSLECRGDAALVEFQHERHSFRRRVRVDGDAIEIRDLEAAGHPFRTLWQLAPECVVEPDFDNDPSQFLIRRGTHRWVLRIDGHEPRIEMTERQVSRAYSRLEPAPSLVVEAKSPIRLTIERR